MYVTAKPKQGQQLLAQGSNQANPAKNIAPGKMFAGFVKEYRDEDRGTSNWRSVRAKQ